MSGTAFGSTTCIMFYFVPMLICIAMANSGDQNVVNEIGDHETLMQFKEEIVQLKADLAPLAPEVRALRKENSQMRSELEKLKASPRVQRSHTDRWKGSVTYVHWGRSSCENDADIVYKGYAAGGHYSQGGSGSNFLCLHEHPEWNKYLPGMYGWMGRIYGVEYEFFQENNVFSYRNHGGMPLGNFPAPCAVCQVPSRSAMIMVPGRIRCPAGWTKEYHGYIVSQSATNGRLRSQYICWDEAPESAVGGKNKDQAVIYPVQVGCGSLPCSRYHEGFELTCVVCTQ